VEPIAKVIGPTLGVDAAARLSALLPVTRDDSRPDRDSRRRKPQRRPAPAPDAGVTRDDDGHVHVDLHA